MAAELEALTTALANAKRPLVAIVAGSKVSTKLTILEALADQVDQLIVGGGIANTFLLAQGAPIGKSLAEPDLVEEARRILTRTVDLGRAASVRRLAEVRRDIGRVEDLSAVSDLRRDRDRDAWA